MNKIFIFLLAVGLLTPTHLAESTHETNHYAIRSERMQGSLQEAASGKYLYYSMYYFEGQDTNIPAKPWQ